MEHLTIEEYFFEKQQKAEYTDCSFVFKVETEEGKFAKKVIHGHKLIISAVSKYFEINFKPEWNGNQPIGIETFDITVFDKLMRAVYLNEIQLENLDEGLQMYEAAHFYQMEKILEILRKDIPMIVVKDKTLTISELVKTAWKYEDHDLISFVTKFFITNTRKIIFDPDFLHFSPKVINSLFLHDDLSASEFDLVKALEFFLNNNILNSDLKPAIGAIRFLSLPKEEILKTTLLSQSEKDFLLGKKNLNIFYLSKNRKAREAKSFFSRLPSKIQLELMHKANNSDYCWVCETGHYDEDANYTMECYELQRKYPGYEKIGKLTITKGFCNDTRTKIIEILKALQKMAKKFPEFDAFANIDDVLTNIYYV